MTKRSMATGRDVTHAHSARSRNCGYCRKEESAVNNDSNDMAANEDLKRSSLAATMLVKNPRNRGGDRAKR